MAKWMLIFIMAMVTVYIATAEQQVQISLDNVTWEDVNTTKFGGEIDEVEKKSYAALLDPGTVYYFRARNETTSWAYASQRTNLGDEFSMASLSVTLFFGALTFALFWLAFNIDFVKGHKAGHIVANLIIKRVFIIAGLLLISLDTTMIVTMADNASLGINKEIFRYLWIVNWTIYFTMAFTVYRTFIDSIKLANEYAKQARMGFEDGGHQS